jgi:hypothetical protein
VLSPLANRACLPWPALAELCPDGAGLDSWESCQGVPLGDLITTITTYDTRHNLTSNSLASYFHDIGE